MSRTIEEWIITIQDALPKNLRNAPEWRQLLPLAVGTGRSREPQRLYRRQEASLPGGPDSVREVAIVPVLPGGPVEVVVRNLAPKPPTMLAEGNAEQERGLTGRPADSSVRRTSSSVGKRALSHCRRSWVLT